MKKKNGCNNRTQNFYFNFDLPKGVGKNLKHEIKLIIEREGYLTENKRKKQDWAITLQIYG